MLTATIPQVNYVTDTSGKPVFVQIPIQEWTSFVEAFRQFATQNAPHDKVVMTVRVTSSVLDEIQAGKIYRVYDDSENDERYIIADNEEKVLFDKNIFKCEVL